MSDCPHFGKPLGGCKFVPRYDVGQPTLTKLTNFSGSLVDAIEASKPRTYVRDVCVRCGKTIERKAR